MRSDWVLVGWFFRPGAITSWPRAWPSNRAPVLVGRRLRIYTIKSPVGLQMTRPGYDGGFEAPTAPVAGRFTRPAIRRGISEAGSVEKDQLGLRWTQTMKSAMHAEGDGHAGWEPEAFVETNAPDRRTPDRRWPRGRTSGLQRLRRRARSGGEKRGASGQDNG